jgi:TRAP-type C4-dicarboxylate transport system permease small subunit
LIIGGGNLVSLTWLLGQYSPVLDVPMAFIYFAIPFSGFLFLIYSLYFFIAAASITQQARVPLDEQENAND